MPYFCGSNQRFTNLVTSDAWKKEVHPKVEASGFKALFYVVIDPRVVAVRKGGNKVITPADLWREVPRTGISNAAAVLPHGRRQPDTGCLG
jgi:hypothetical protein